MESNAPNQGSDDAPLSVLLSCFAGAERASKVRGALGKGIREAGGTILDEVVLKVSAAGKAQVHDPRRTIAGTLTSALTWGLFGLVVGGLQGLGVWGVLGAICGGLYAYLTEHLLTKNELHRIGERLPKDSSAIAVFVQGSDPERLLSSTAPLEASTASVASIASDLSARVLSGTSHPTRSATNPGGASPGNPTTELRMLLIRFAGERAARDSLTKSASSGSAEEPQVELVVEANKDGRRRVIDPKTGTAAMSRSDVISWGGFGLVWGAIVGLSGNGGVLGSVESGLVTGVAWAVFGLVAGALYGLWAGRGVSARRLKGIGVLIPPDTSLILAWAGGTVMPGAIERWAASGSERLTLRFNPIGRGVVIEV